MIDKGGWELAPGGWARGVTGEGLGGEATIDAQLADLRRRIGELGRSVEVLGARGVWPGFEPPGLPIAALPATPPSPLLASAPAASPPPELAGWELPLDPEPPRRSAPAAVVSGDRGGSRSAGTSEAAVTVLDAGPLVDLIELRHFEEDLAGLAAVHEVLVRRYGRGRARIEVEAAGPDALARELVHLRRPMDVEVGDDGVLRVDLASPAPGALAEGARDAEDAGR